MTLAEAMERIAELLAENQSQKAELTRLRADLARMSERIEHLIELVGENKAARKRKAAKKKDDPPPPTPPELTEEQRRAFEERPKAPDAPEPPTSEPRAQRRPGRLPVPASLPIHAETLQADRCPNCHSEDLAVVDSRVVEHLDAALALVRNRQTRIRDCLCKQCGADVPAPRPVLPYDRAKVTGAMLAYLMYLAFYLLVPLDRISNGLRANGVSMSLGYLVKLKKRAADLLAAIDNHHMQQLLSRPWMGVDGTGHKVIMEGLPGTQAGHLDVFCNPDLVVFRFVLSKRAELLADRLAGFRGTIVCDGESRNGLLFESGDVTEAGCNAHVVRKLEEAAREQPVLAAEGLGFMARIYEKHRASDDLRGPALQSYREQQVAPLYEALAKWRDAVLPTLSSGDGLAKTLRYLQNQWKPLTRWLTDPTLPPDNNISEREFQRIAKGRLAWLFFGGPNGGHRAATILGIVATCHRIGVDVLSYLGWVFTAVGPAARDPAAMTPAAFKLKTV
jgi:transposase